MSGSTKSMPKPGDRVVIATAGASGRMLEKTSPSSGWYTDGDDLNIALVPVEELETGEVRWFRSSVVELDAPE